MSSVHSMLVRWLAAAALCAGVALMVGCDRSSRVSTSEPSAELPDQEVTDFVVSETDTGRIEWKLYAQTAAMYNVRSTVIARGVRVDFYDELGRRSSTLTAREGELNQVRKDMSARGDVVVQTTEGTRMNTQALRFDNQTHKITSDQFVRVERHGDVVTGYGFESDPNLEHFEFKREVHAVVRTGSGGMLEQKSEIDTAASKTRVTRSPQPKATTPAARPRIK